MTVSRKKIHLISGENHSLTFLYLSIGIYLVSPLGVLASREPLVVELNVRLIMQVLNVAVRPPRKYKTRRE